MLRHLANGAQANSLSNRLRTARFRQFEGLISGLPRPVRILDVGGTNEFWENRGWAGRSDIEIHSLNLVAEEKKHPNIFPVAGDATKMTEHENSSFDVVFSNSVIEHLFTWENQVRMAAEVRRVGKAYWVQTPNFWFPIEPHFHALGWQWLPVGIRVAMLRRRRFGWRGPCPDPAQARSLVEEIRLIKKHELELLFPGAALVAERFGGFVKSWTAISFPEPRASFGS